MEKDFDVIALGELLIDMTDNGTTQSGNTCLKQIPEVHHVMFWQC